MSVAVTADESTSVGMGAFCLPFPGGPGARAVLPTDTCYGNNHHVIQADFLDTTDLPGGAAAAAAPGSPHSDMHMDSDLLQGSGGEKQIDYVNTHGTSTPVGDLKELDAIKTVFTEAGYQPHALYFEGSTSCDLRADL